MTRRPKSPETQVHMEIAFRRHYVSQQVFEELDDACDKILSQIVKMIDHADRWVIQSQKNPRRTFADPIRTIRSSTPTRQYAPRRYAHTFPPTPIRFCLRRLTNAIPSRYLNESFCCEYSLCFP
jgi:hypothetical protein